MLLFDRAIVDMITTNAAEMTDHVEQPSSLTLICRLSYALQTESINYCHWKSNVALKRVASGANDLDLLIHRSDAQRFTEILYGLGFKEARDQLEQLPGVLDYYGYDQATDRFVHVHAHYQLIIGHDRTKNYRLPIEEAYLASATQRDLFRIPALEFEFIVFVVRMLLKHGTWDAVLAREGKLPRAVREEFAYLQTQVEQPQIEAYLQQFMPFLTSALFERCVQALQPTCSTWKRILVSYQLQMALRPYARRTLPMDVSLKIGRRLVRAIYRRTLHDLPGKRLTRGGMMIAIVGGDGAGKSTAVNELKSWLAREFDVAVIHMGKPEWSWMTYVVRGLLKIGRLVGDFGRPAAVYAGSGSAPPIRPNYSTLLWEVCTARDRYWAYAQARRLTTNGGLVICDRFPLPQIELMEAPQIERMVAPDQLRGFVKFLARLERSYYPYFIPPEAVIVLRLDPEIAVQRKTTENPAYVRMRNTEIWKAAWQQTTAHVIDAGCAKGEVLARLKSLIWSDL